MSDSVRQSGRRSYCRICLLSRTPQIWRQGRTHQLCRCILHWIVISKKGKYESFSSNYCPTSIHYLQHLYVVDFSNMGKTKVSGKNAWSASSDWCILSSATVTLSLKQIVKYCSINNVINTKVIESLILGVKLKSI